MERQYVDPVIGLVIVWFLIIISIPVVYYSHYKKEKERQRELRENFEKEQAEKGLVKFVDVGGVEHWGTPEEVERWRSEEEEKAARKRVVTTKETIIKEIVKVRCKYCNTLYDSKLDRCPYCGAHFPK